MPKYESRGGKWFPVDEAAKEICKQKGIEYLGSALNPNKGNTGVLAVPTFPKLAQNKLDGVQVADPTPEQKAKIAKKTK